MIIRTYGRRSRSLTRTFSDSQDDDVSYSPPLPQQKALSQDIYNFPFTSSQEFNDEVSKNHETTVRKRNFDFEDSENGVVRRSKKQKKEVGYTCLPWISPNSTLMEAQEFGEMIEHVDEVNFAVDGLKKGQQLRIRRASLLSLLSICATSQQRRLLRTHGMAKKIIDAIMGLNFDDTPSNLAAVALFYVLTSDGQDEHLLESPGCIQFLIKMLKPIIPVAKENKMGKVGFKLLAFRKDADISRDTTKVLDSSSAAIISKVEEILDSCKELKPICGDGSGLRGPELSPKWIVLLTLEKACLSKISLEDTTGMVRKTGDNFKEKLREQGGLDAVFEVAIECHSVMEGWVKQSLSSVIEDKKDLQILALLSKCLKIMENAAFLSSDNQVLKLGFEILSNLLDMKCQLNSQGSPISFTKLVISVIKILSGLYLKKPSALSCSQRACIKSKAISDVNEFGLTANSKVDRDDIIYNNSTERSSSLDCSYEKSFSTSQNDPGPSMQWMSCSASSSQTTTSTNDSLLKIRINSSLTSSCSGKLGISYDNHGSGSGSFCERHERTAKFQLLGESQDPYEFDADDFAPSKWELLSRQKKKSQTKKRGKLGVRNGEMQDGNEYQFAVNQQKSSNRETGQLELLNEENHSNATSGSQNAEEEYSSLLSDCLLAAVKVLMNLTNDNPLGCQQIAASGALEALPKLIASHFPSFCSYFCLASEMEENSLGAVYHRNDRPLTDPELDFLVAILGLLVNLVEKDGYNRSRLAAASVSLPNSEGLGEESQMEVIPLLCAVFLANQGEDGAAGEVLPWNDEAAVLQEEKEAEKMILEAYAALLLAFLSTESKSTRNAIADCLPNRNLAILVPVLERFVAFHFTLNMISPETHKAVSEVIESCRIP